jgi:dTDP-4-dehydrorhamnose 3,5-epimerase
MIFSETEVHGAYAIELERIEDGRGFNARMWCQREFEAQGLVAHVKQTNIIFNKHRGTVRGVHYQAAPHSEAKTVRCTRGAIFAVVLDLHRDSPTYRRWAGIELTPDNYRMLYVPATCALGSQALKDDSEIVYQVSEFYHPESGRGVRYDDPAFGIRWPLQVASISEKDKSWPPYSASA